MGTGDRIGQPTESFDAGGREPMSMPVAGTRYVLLDPIGEGGHAVVFTAYDKKLNRKVAVKLVRGAALGAQGRLLREAQALARLRHPNVVTVYDVGAFEDRVFIAMELVEGKSLRGWLAEGRRSWREVVAVFLAAGRGLAAAHAEGLVHRDFKPDNVLVGRDGSVRVADFGLVRAVGEMVDEPASSPPSPLAIELTGTGAIVGTPRYMSPEQYAGAAVDARGDQFSFCVALFEALHGQTPFSGDSAAEVLANVAEGNVRPSVPGRRMPAWLSSIVRRGLRAAPDQRWPSMDALLGELGRDRWLARRRLLVASGVAAMAVLMLFALSRRGRAPDVCLGADAKMARAWDAPKKEAVRLAFAGTGRPYAAEVFRLVAGRVDEYAAGWTAMHTEACRATAVRHEQSEALLDLRIQCLDRRLDELDSLVALLGSGPDASVLDRAVDAVSGLAPLSGCADREALMSVVAPPADPKVRVAVTSLRTRMARAKVLGLAGNDDEYARLADEAVAEARRLGYAPAEAEALVLAALSRQGRVDGKGAESLFDQALVAAARARDDDQVASIMVYLLRSIGLTQARPLDALALRPMAEAAVLRAGNRPGLRTRLLANLGVVLREKGDLAEARRTLEEAIAVWESDSERDDQFGGDIRTDLAIAIYKQGNVEAARPQFEQALAAWERSLGPGNMKLAMGRGNLGIILLGDGQIRAARDVMRQALSTFAEIEGQDGAEVGQSAGIIAEMDLMLGDTADAGLQIERALAVLLPRLGPQHTRVASVVRTRAELLDLDGRYADAEADARRAMAVEEKARGPEHTNVAACLQILGRIHIHAGTPREALPLLERALAIHEKAKDDDGRGRDLVTRADAWAALGKHAQAAEDAASALAIRDKLAPDGAPAAEALTALGEARLALGRADDAAPVLERAIAINATTDAGPAAVARTRFVLAQTLWAQARGDRRRAVELAGQANATYAALGGSFERRRVEADRWLAERR